MLGVLRNNVNNKVRKFKHEEHWVFNNQVLLRVIPSMYPLQDETQISKEQLIQLVDVVHCHSWVLKVSPLTSLPPESYLQSHRKRDEAWRNQRNLEQSNQREP